MNTRARQHIDALIDRVHTDWPTAAFVLRLPSGEQMMLPPHHQGEAQCAPGHTGYFSDRILPSCQAHPTPRHGGRCWATPLTSNDDPPTIPAYITDRRFGILTAPISTSRQTPHQLPQQLRTSQIPTTTTLDADDQPRTATAAGAQ